MANIKVKNANGEWESTAIANVRAFSEPIVLTGSCETAFSNDFWKNYLDQILDGVTTNNLTSVSQIFGFYDKDFTTYPFVINGKDDTILHLGSLCYNCKELLSAPIINNKIRFSQASNMFYGCNKLRYVPEGWSKDFIFTDFNNSSSSSSNPIGSGTGAQGGFSGMFYGCNSLLSIDSNLLKNLYSKAKANGGSYSQLFCYCRMLGSIENLGVQAATLTNNCFYITFWDCNRLGHFTFTLDENNAPKVVSWKNQTIDLSLNVGYTNLDMSDNNNLGFTTDTQVTNADTYATLKNNPDWWTADINYSRYNHDSAVETINSLPDTSAYGTNTIKFKGASGALTDGGAINTLTTEEIAVATSKGWTVSLV